MSDDLMIALSQPDNSSITANVMLKMIVYPKMAILISYPLISFLTYSRLIFICGKQMKIF